MGPKFCYIYLFLERLLLFVFELLPVSLFVAEPLLLELVEELAFADDLLLRLGLAC
jgi:hypothetical protein